MKKPTRRFMQQHDRPSRGVHPIYQNVAMKLIRREVLLIRLCEAENLGSNAEEHAPPRPGEPKHPFKNP